MKHAIVALSVASVLAACDARASSSLPQAQTEDLIYALTVKIDDV